MTALDTNSAAKRAQAVDAACRVIRHGGVEAANLRAIAAEMGATTGLLTRYFPGKQELLQSVLQLTKDTLNSHLQTAILGRAGLDLVRASVRAALPLDPERREAWAIWLAFLGLIPGDASLNAIHAQFPDALRQVLIRGLRDAQREGALPAQLYPANAADALMCQITGVAVRAASMPDKHPPEKIEAFVAGAFAALLAG